MRKTFTIKNSNFKAITKDKGAIDFLLVDETGEKRTVSAIAKIGRNKNITSVTAIHKRETPLVEALAKASLRDTIEVDFTGFNNKHPRVVKAPIARANSLHPKAIPQPTVEAEATIAFSMTKSQLILMGLSIVLLIILVV